MEVVGGVSLRPARLRHLTPGEASAGSFLPRRLQLARTAARPARRALVVEARGGRGWSDRQSQQQRRMPQLPKIEDDGNPRFVIFIRTANVYSSSIPSDRMNGGSIFLVDESRKPPRVPRMQVYFWYPLNIVTGGTTAKIMLAAKDNFLGKYIYKDTLARNLATVIYKDEDDIIDLAKEQFRVLKGETEFRYGYKIVEKGNLRSALATSNVLELPKKEELKSVVDKVRDFFGEVTSGAKESFAQITGSASAAEAEAEAKAEDKRPRSKRRGSKRKGKQQKPKQGFKPES
ncbi:protein HHL1, chloroplastic isoform X1 [Triticum aestivum]|uniref:protein HHL1, chloroplastic isoform X1 n=1 Tax=Triticum aestivum TaxID=4565 RepID=UPI001D01BA3D|nr:protein HHL1, chloroplastic-like isoform X1 [Triticum aestivum]